MLSRPHNVTENSLRKSSAATSLVPKQYDIRKHDSPGLAELNPRAPNFVPGMPGNIQANCPSWILLGCQSSLQDAVLFTSTVQAGNKHRNPLTCQPLNTSGVTGRETSPENGHHNAVAQQHSGAALKGKVIDQALVLTSTWAPSQHRTTCSISDTPLCDEQGSHQSPGANEGAHGAVAHSRESDLSKALRSTQNGHAAQQPR